ncbi:histone deacetylase complex subunit SAP30 isoform X1 [Malaclemys terrapin pileata]|uniref:histone deacetylase complex subunit SAP30 isoform X1 n=1 Tax=Malaclemys terrapin pileata TaxID=2991368 RepID=UPI0023A7AB29|nr:histone deacetylase complex subunit SAP30 isoform X1 [Malaclemys terrapin pileata]
MGEEGKETPAFSSSSLLLPPEKSGWYSRGKLFVRLPPYCRRSWGLHVPPRRPSRAGTLHVCVADSSEGSTLGRSAACCNAARLSLPPCLPLGSHQALRSAPLYEKSPQACVTVRRQDKPPSPFPSLLRKKHPLARHLYICDFHKNLIQSVRNRRKRKGSDDDGDSPVQDIDTPEVDLYQLQVNTLRRYKRHFKLQTRPGLNKAQLVEIIGCHFRTIPVNEKDTLTYFIYSVKNDKNKPDLKMDSGVH